MFTGIIKHVGKLTKHEQSLYVFQAEKEFCEKLEKGTSVSVNGACLTVTDLPDSSSFSVVVMPETEAKTMLTKLNTGDFVNLELPVTASDFLSGHVVQGHVDGVGTIKKIEEEGNSHIFTIEIPPDLKSQIVEKGSLAVNGISLTVIEQKESHFTVGIIPFTWENTMLYKAKEGDLVNIETDILAKYVEKILKKS